MTRHTPRSRSAIATAHLVAEQLRPGSAELDRDHRLLADRYDVLRTAGHLASPVPSELGGLGADLADVVRSQRIVAAACANTALAVNMHLFQVGAAAERWRADGTGRPVLRQVAEDGLVLASTTGEAISLEPFATSTTAEISAGRVRLDGRKRFCSQACVMDRVRLLAFDRRADELVLVVVPADAPGLSIDESTLTTGMRGTQSFDLLIDGVEVADDAISARPIDPIPLRDPTIRAGAVWFQCTLAGVYAGIADDARAEASRIARTGPTPLAAVERAHRRLDAVLEQGLHDTVTEHDPWRRLAIAVATCREVIAGAEAVVDECVTAVGSRAYSTSSRIEQCARNVRAGRHHPPDATTTDRLLDHLATGRAIDD